MYSALLKYQHSCWSCVVDSHGFQVTCKTVMLWSSSMECFTEVQLTVKRDVALSAVLIKDSNSGLTEDMHKLAWYLPSMESFINIHQVVKNVDTTLCMAIQYASAEPCLSLRSDLDFGSNCLVVVGYNPSW